jgi:hypothetical protein
MNKQVLILLCLALTASCKRSPAPAPPAPAPGPTASTSPRTDAAPEFADFAKKFESAAISLELEGKDFFDNSSFDPKAKSDLITELTRSLLLSDYHLLRVYHQDGKTRALFRLLQPNGGFNYHEWLLHRSSDGKVRAYDCFIVSAGYYDSEFMERIHSIRGPESNGQPARAENMTQYAQYVQAMAHNLRQERYRDVLVTYNDLPATLLKEKVLLFLRLQAAAGLASISPGEFKRAANDVEKLFPENPTLHFHTIAVSFEARNYPALHQAIDRLERWTGGDPWLHYLRARGLMEEGKPDAPALAEKLLRTSIAGDSALLDPRRQLIHALAQQEKYGAAVEALKEYELQAEIILTDEALPNTKSLTTSQPYRNYRAQQESAKPSS